MSWFGIDSAARTQAHFNEVRRTEQTIGPELAIFRASQFGKSDLFAFDSLRINGDNYHAIHFDEIRYTDKLSDLLLTR
jgi:hypothetical protein